MFDHLADALSVAEQVAADLTANGARAVVLVGSVARGDARPTSDVDLIALGSGPSYQLLIRANWQTSVSWRTADEIRASYRRPADACGAVPAWRNATVLADASGQAAQLRAEAHAWDWPQIDEAANAWVAEQVTGYAEEVHRLVGQTAGGSARTAAVMRSLLAVQVPTVLAVHHRLLYDSENRLWDLVAEAEGPQWTTAQDAALGVTHVPAAVATRAALDLYAMAARRAAHLLNTEQSAVVRRALTVANSTPRPAGSATDGIR
jgi:hypothetical protein